MILFFPIVTLKALLPLLAIIAGIFVISTKNAIISVFNLIVLYILVAFYLIYIGVTYLGISYIIIYIGAIAILFLFIIMMIDIEVVEKRSNNYLPLLFLLLSGFFFTLKKFLYNIGLIKMKSFKFKEELVLIDHAYGKLFNINDFNYYHREDKKGVKFDNVIKDNLISLNDDFYYKNSLLFMILNKKEENEEENFNKFKFDSFFKDTKNEGYYNLYLDLLRDSNIEEFINIKKDIHKYEQLLQEKDNNIFFENIIDYSSKYFEVYAPSSKEQYISSYDEGLLSKISSEKRRK
jgi:NADH-ubiquinone oxidoreductase chain 6